MDSTINNVKVNVQPRSGFDKAFMSGGHGQTGSLQPIFIDEVLPNSKVNMKIAMNVNLPPLANDVFMRCSMKVEAFFVPMRLLVGNFQQWFTGVDDTDTGDKARLPYVMFDPQTEQADSDLCRALASDAFLFDSLGFRIGNYPSVFDTLQGYLMERQIKVSLMPFLAYNKIYDDWYRRTLIQRPVFVRPTENINFNAPNCRFMPYYYQHGSGAIGTIVNADMLIDNNYTMADGVSVFAVRQRNFGDDAFTVAQTSPQLGTARAVSTAGSQFTIAALRAENSMQEFEEFNQLAGGRFQDQLRVRYGANLSDGVAQRALCLGTGEFEVYSKGVFQSGGETSSRNPYNSVAARYGSAYASGDEFIISNFHAQEPGYIMVLATLVPRRTYATGVLPLLTKYTGDGADTSAVMGNAVLQNVGNQVIDVLELGFPDGRHGLVPFGYQQRFAEYMYRNDEIHGQLRPGGLLQNFALGTVIDPYAGVAPEVSTAFLQIPKTYIDSIFAVEPQAHEPRYWYDVFFDYKVSQPLAKYSIPSLQNPAYEHGDTISIRRGGISL